MLGTDQLEVPCMRGDQIQQVTMLSTLIARPARPQRPPHPAHQSRRRQGPERTLADLRRERQLCERPQSGWVAAPGT
jgi:hypothetical protein